MNRIPLAATLVLVVLAGCGEKTATPGDSAVDGKHLDAATKAGDAGKRAIDESKPVVDDGKAVLGRAQAKKDWAAQIGDVPFSADWKTAMAQAKASKRPLMFLFTDKANAEGAKMGAGAFKDAKVVAAATAFVPAVVDADADAPLAEQFGARTTPMVVYASPTGEILGSTISASDLLSDMTAALATMKSNAAGDK